MPSLVVQTSFLGDMVLTTPLLAHLARRGPVDVLATPAAGALLAQNPAVRAVLPYDKRRRDRGIAGFARLASRLRRRNYDIAYLAQGSLRSAALAVSAGIPHRVGFDTSAGRALYTRRVPYDDTVHHAARLLALGEQSGESPLTPDQLPARLSPRISEVYTKGTLTLARLGREAPIAAANPAGPVLRNVEGGSLAARLLYPSVRHTAPPELPRSPVIGTDAPVQYEQRDDIGAPRKRLPASRVGGG